MKIRYKATFTPPFIQRLIINRFEVLIGVTMMLIALIAAIGVWFAVNI